MGGAAGIALFVIMYGWPIYLPVIVLVAGSLFGAVIVAIVGGIRTGFTRPAPAEDVDVAEFFADAGR